MGSPNKGKIWTTKQGKKLDISEMDYHHILNCINMLKRKSIIISYKGYDKTYKALTSEIDYRDNLKKKPKKKISRFQLMDI